MKPNDAKETAVATMANPNRRSTVPGAGTAETRYRRSRLRPALAVSAVVWLLSSCPWATKPALARDNELIPDFNADLYTPKTYDPYDLELLTDHCTNGYGNQTWSKSWIDVSGLTGTYHLYIGGFCDDHDFCYLSDQDESADFEKDNCDTPFL